MPKQSRNTKTTRKLEHPERYRCSEFIKLTPEKQQEKRLEYLYQIKQIMENRETTRKTGRHPAAIKQFTRLSDNENKEGSLYFKRQHER